MIPSEPSSSLEFFESNYQQPMHDRQPGYDGASEGLHMRSHHAAPHSSPQMTFMTQPGSGPHDALPLLEELGIDFGHIQRQTVAVLTVGLRALAPGRHGQGQQCGAEALERADLTGPLLYCLAFGSLLLLGGNNHFGYVYGFGGVGSVGVFGLLNLMHPRGVALYQCISVLGYSLVPMIFLSFLRLFLQPSALAGLYGGAFAALTILWCAYSASYLFVRGLQMTDHLLLVLYPLLLFYTAFGLLAIF